MQLFGIIGNLCVFSMKQKKTFLYGYDLHCIKMVRTLLFL